MNETTASTLNRLRPEDWLARVDDLENSIRQLCRDAREQDEPAAVDAVADMLSKLEGELLESALVSRHQRAGQSTGAFHPLVRPAAALAETCLQRVAFVSSWTAAGLRLRLKQDECDER